MLSVTPSPRHAMESSFVDVPRRFQEPLRNDKFRRVYQQPIGFHGDFFSMIGNMGADLFGMTWVQAIVTLFSYLAWAMYEPDWW